MKKHFSALLALLLGLFLLVGGLFPPAADPAFDLEGFGRLPVLADGRIKPMDTVARSSLLIMQGRQRVIDQAGHRLPPVAWLLDVFYRSEQSNTHPHFEIVHPDVLALFRLRSDEGDGGKRFSYTQLEPRLEELDRQAALAEDVPSAVRTPFQRAILNTRYHLVLYQQLRHSLVPPNRPGFLGELQAMEDQLPAALQAVRQRQAGEEHDEALAGKLMTQGQLFLRLEQFANLLPIPPLDPAGGSPEAWAKTGQVLLQAFQTERINPYALTYAALGQAWRDQDAERFNTLVGLYTAQLRTGFGPELRKAAVEASFNTAAPFYRSQVLYLIAFLLAVFSWLRWSHHLGRAAFWLVALAFVATTVGIATRMWLEGRPPVTNLYSSALFVGWGAVGLCLVIEAIYRNAIGSVAGSAVGFCTLVVAHHLSLGGDTLEMMRAVLDSNFWLATHVIVITIGYSAVFLAGFLAIIYVGRGLFTRSLDAATATALERMVYGILCFATLFNLVGTVLGGIWADQSWGRFWGWDPKENGALMIVLWCAIILHARWGKLVNTRGLMALAIGGNIITSWSWFGTNMLGIGLHSYGFMDAAFRWLMIFVVSQLALIALALLPTPRWRSPAAAR